MQERIVKITERLLPLIDRFLTGLEWLVKQVVRAWVWLNSLDIPLSPLQWVLLFYVIFGVAYTVSTPVFEANDEIWHFGYVQYIRETGELPVQPNIDNPDSNDQQETTENFYRQHGNQPPLYYGLMALITSPFSIDDVDQYRNLNPHVTINQPDSFGNKNLVLHDETHSMWEGTGLTVQVIRIIGLALGAVTIVTVYEISKYVAPHRPTVAFVAAAITGLNPMFIFVSASVNNDSLAMVLNGLIILLTLRTMRDGFSLRHSLIITFLLGLTAITKVTSLVLIPLLIGVGIYTYRKTDDRQGLIVFLVAMLVFIAGIAGWWYIRNLQLYGELFGIFTMANIAGPRGVTFNLITLLTEYQQFRMSYWGLFGSMNIQIVAIFYMLVDLITFFSVIGCVFLLLQLVAISDFAYARYELSNLMVLISGFLLVWFGVLYFSTLTKASDGRILFPLIAILSPLVAVGFVEIVWWIVFSLRPPNLEFVRAGDAVPKPLLDEAMLWPLRFLGIVTLLTPFTVIASQYIAPDPVITLPETAKPVYAEFGDVALVGYEHIDRRYVPGEDVNVTLYWEVLEQSERDNSIFLSLIDDNLQEIGRYSSYPGAGTLRTSTWEAGQIYPDEYVVGIDQGAYGRYPFDIQVEWENLDVSNPISATSAEGDIIEPVLLDVGAIVSLRVESNPQGFAEILPEFQPSFDQMIRLREFLIDAERNEIVLHWQADSTPDDDYTVFAHVLDEDGNILAQADAPPRLPTGYWRWGESYLTYHTFPENIDILDYTIIVGWYLNDGLTYPRLEYETIVDDEQVFLDSYEIPWDIAFETFELTAEVTAEATDEMETPEANRRPVSGTGESTDEPESTAEETDEAGDAETPEAREETETDDMSEDDIETTDEPSEVEETEEVNEDD